MSAIPYHPKEIAAQTTTLPKDCCRRADIGIDAASARQEDEERD
jgi:hypothetical protein